MHYTLEDERRIAQKYWDQCEGYPHKFEIDEDKIAELVSEYEAGREFNANPHIKGWKEANPETNKAIQEHKRAFMKMNVRNILRERRASAKRNLIPYGV